MGRYRVSLTERLFRDWVVEVDADSEEEAEKIAQEQYESLGTDDGLGVIDVDVDWTEELP